MIESKPLSTTSAICGHGSGRASDRAERNA
jgi:hypothetical protein